MEVKFGDGPAPLKVESVAIRAHPSQTDPLAQRSYLGLKFEGGITAMYTERPPGQREAARVDLDVCLQLCEEVHARCFKELQAGLTEGRVVGDGPKSAAGKLRDCLFGVEQERDNAIRRAEEAETRLDELQRAISTTRISAGGDNAASNRDV